METDEKFFSFVVKTDFSGSHHRFDQCGIVMYLDSENWLKGSVEYENEQFQHLGSVVTNHGGFQLYFRLYRYEDHRMRLEGPRRPAARRIKEGYA